MVRVRVHDCVRVPNKDIIFSMCSFARVYLNSLIYISNMPTQVSADAIRTRRDQGWLVECTVNLNQLIKRIRKYRRERKAVSIGYLGNIVDVWWVRIGSDIYITDVATPRGNHGYLG